MPGENFVERAAPALDLPRRNGNIGGLSARAPGRLMDHHAAVGQGKALALRPGGKQYGGHAGRLADAIGRDVTLQEVHRVVDRHSACHHPAGGIDVELNVFLGILHLEEQELGDDQVRHAIVDRRADKDDPVLQQPGEDIHAPLPAAGVFNDKRDVIAHEISILLILSALPW